MNHIDLFSGIGGFSLAAHWAGFETLCHCENAEFPQEVLRKNFPNVPICEDVNGFYKWFVRRFGRPRVDLLTGGFPCQDISCANSDGKGLDGDRSGLWFTMLAIIRRVRPAYVVAENVPNLYSRGIDTVLSGLELAGYEASAFVMGAWVIGAPHRRDRVFIVAKRRDLPNTNSEREQQSEGLFPDIERWSRDCHKKKRVENTACRRIKRVIAQWHADIADGNETHGSTPLGSPSGGGCGRITRRRAGAITPNRYARPQAKVANPFGKRQSQPGQFGNARRQKPDKGRQTSDAIHADGTGWSAESGMGGNATGVPGWVDGNRHFNRFPAPPSESGDQYEYEPPRLAKRIKNREHRLKALGNALVPQQVFPILLAIRNRILDTKEPINQ